MKNKISNHNMAIPEVLYSELESIANEKATTVSEIMKMLIKTGLCVYNINKTGGEVIVKTKDDDTAYDVDGCVYCGRCHVFIGDMTETTAIKKTKQIDIYELVSKQQIEIENQKSRILALEGSLSAIHILMICCGGPLNDNYMKYSKEQSEIFYRMQDIIEEVNIKD